jgi:hypothetical protein
MSENFETWLMFTPDGGHPVPLRAVNWFWSGSATNGPDGWGLSSSSDNHSHNPTDFETETYPFWKDNVTHFYWQPPLP